MWIHFIDNGRSYRARITKVIKKAIPFIRKENKEYFLEVEELDGDYDRYYPMINYKIPNREIDIIWHLETSLYTIYQEKVIIMAKNKLSEHKRENEKAKNRMNRLNIVVKR